VDSGASLIAWSLALGTVGAINIPVSSALLLDLAPVERRQSVLALNYASMSIAYTLGVVPAGYIAQQSYSLLAATSAAGYLVVALLYALALKGALPMERAGEDKGVVRNTLSAFRDRRFALFAAVAFVFPLSMGMLISVLPLYGASVGLGEGYIGLVLGANSVLVAVLALPVASRIESSGPFRWLGAAAAIIGVSLALYVLVPDPAHAFLAGTVLYSFGEVVFSSAVPAAVARLAPPGRRGAYQGGWALVSSLSLGSALFLSGLVAGVGGWPAAWLSAAALTLVAAFALFLLRRGFRPST
jgi:MFS family permease